MKTANEMVKRYIADPKPRFVVRVKTAEQAVIDVTFVWDIAFLGQKARWYLEMPKDVSAVECDRINSALSGTQWNLHGEEHDMPDVLQKIVDGSAQWSQQ